MKKLHLALGILVTCIWGANFSVIKLGLAQLDPFMLTALRFTFCALPLVFVLKRPNVALRVVALYGTLFGVGLWGAVNLGIHVGLSAGLASLILQFSAFFTILLAGVVFRETLSRTQVAGMATACLGLALILGATGGHVSVAGAALVICGALSWSACNLLVRKNKPDDMLAFIVWSSVFSALPLFAITYAVKGAQPFVDLAQSLNAKAIFSILFQAYVTTIFGYWVWNSLMKTYPVSSVAPLSLFVPVAGLVTSWIAYEEHIAVDRIGAALLILAGMGIFLFARPLGTWLMRRPASST